MAKKSSVAADGSPPVESKSRKSPALSRTPLRASSLLDTRVVYCGDNLEQLAKLPDASIDLIYIDPPFNSNRNYEVFWGETKEKRAFADRHESTKAYIDWHDDALRATGARPQTDRQLLLPLRLARQPLRQSYLMFTPNV
jgi:16S rRNA G966 N2-methylase RsmD